MQTHKYVAATMKEALARIKEELGEDALIIKTEKVKAGGRLGNLRQEMIEVTAAMAEEVKGEAQVGPEFAETLERTLTRPMPTERPTEPDPRINEVTDEVRRLRDELLEISKHLKNNQMPNLPRELARVREALDESGVNSQWANDLAHEALIRLGAEELISAPVVENYLMSQIGNSVKPAPTLRAKLARSYKIMLVGSPGAGKTTLIQKLASDPAAYGKKKIGLLTLDTHRMAAIEQLRAFARIAAVPMEVVFQPGQVADAMARLAGLDLILIDTFGCTAADTEKLTLLQRFIEALDPDEIHLVLNSSVRDEELVYTSRKFRDAGISHLSFTRLDESLRHGYLLNVAKMAERPIGWLSQGQGFVGCVERFTPEHLRRWIALSEPVEIPTVETSEPLTQLVTKQ